MWPNASPKGPRRRKSVVKAVLSSPKEARGTLHLGRAHADRRSNMPAPRSCRNCGKPLVPDLRWCPACYEPAREFAPRAPLHHGDFVGSPIPTSGHVPHWSRWEKSATTFGPTARVVTTLILLSTLLPAISYGNIVFVLTFPVAAAVVLNAIWAKGWVVPDEPDLPPLPVDEPPHPNRSPPRRESGGSPPGRSGWARSCFSPTGRFPRRRPCSR